jgi:ADP-ribose pyrophosphatase YjhB (NUDIX family)
VAGIIFNDRGEVLLFKHSYRKEYPWGLPGGWLKKGEQPGDGLTREIQEETGLRVRIEKTFLVEADPSFPRLDIILIGIVEEGTFRASQEVTAAQFFPLADLPEILPGQERLIQRAINSR